MILSAKVEHAREVVCLLIRFKSENTLLLDASVHPVDIPVLLVLVNGFQYDLEIKQVLCNIVN